MVVIEAFSEVIGRVGTRHTKRDERSAACGVGLFNLRRGRGVHVSDLVTTAMHDV